MDLFIQVVQMIWIPEFGSTRLGLALNILVVDYPSSWFIQRNMIELMMHSSEKSKYRGGDAIKK